MADPLAPLAGSGVAPATGENPNPPPAEPTPPTPSPAPAPAPTPPATPAPEPAADGTRSAARIKELNEAKEAAEAAQKVAEDKLADHEKAQLGEKERAERERDEAKQEATEAKAKATRLERAGWAHTAAAAKGFIDPADAVAHLDLTGEKLDTEAKIQNAVAKLAEEKKHLVGQRPAGGFGHPGGTSTTTDDVPVDPETGKPDEALQQGRELLNHLSGQQRS